MTRSTAAGSRFLLALAAVFGVVAVGFGGLGVVASPATLPVAGVFAAVAALFYYHGSGRLRVRLVESARRRRVRRGASTETAGQRTDRAPGRATVDGGLTDAYRALDLEPGASMDAVRDAYREKTRTHHPDRGGDADAFARINRAYERLRDAKTD